MRCKVKDLKYIGQQEPVENLLVIDFEATCDDPALTSANVGTNGADGVDHVVGEIIEIPIVCVDGLTGEIKDTFHTYVKPQYSKISAYCTALTSITQEMVDNAPTFEEAWKLVQTFLHEGKYTKDNSVCITFGSSDFGVMLPNQLALCARLAPVIGSARLPATKTASSSTAMGTVGTLGTGETKTATSSTTTVALGADGTVDSVGAANPSLASSGVSPAANTLSGGKNYEPLTPGSSIRSLINDVESTGIVVPDLFKQWYDIKYSYRMFYKVATTTFASMVKHSGIEMVGTFHSGLSDALNTAAILKKMIADGYGIGRTKVSE